MVKAIAIIIATIYQLGIMYLLTCLIYHSWAWPMTVGAPNFYIFSLAATILFTVNYRD